MSEREYARVGQESHEHADVNRERSASSLTLEIRRKLDQLRNGVMCSQCGWQRATRVWRSRLLCAGCCQVEQTMRSLDITAAKIHRTT